MRIHTRIVLNIESGEILKDEFYEYTGEVALCDGGDDGGDGDDGNLGSPSEGLTGDSGAAEAAAAAAEAGSYGIGATFDLGEDFGSISSLDNNWGGVNYDNYSVDLGDFSFSGWGVESGLGGMQGDYSLGADAAYGEAAFSAAMSTKGWQEDLKKGKELYPTTAKIATVAGLAIPGIGKPGALIAAIALAAKGNKANAEETMALWGYTPEQIDQISKAHYAGLGITEDDWSDLDSGDTEKIQAAEAKFWPTFSAEEQQSLNKEVQMGAVMGDINTLLSQGQVGSVMDKSFADLIAISEAHSLAELTGELSQKDQELLERMRTNSITNLSEIVNEETEDLIKSKIADLTDRGVLAGNIATQALADIDKYRTQKLTQGTRDIETFLAGKELDLIGQEKGRQIDLWELEAKTDLTKAGFALDWEGKKLGAATQWDVAKLNALTDIYGIEKTGEWKGADIALGREQLSAQTALGYAQAEAAEDASKWNAWGNIGSGLGMGLMYSLWS